MTVIDGAQQIHLLYCLCLTMRRGGDMRTLTDLRVVHDAVEAEIVFIPVHSSRAISHISLYSSSSSFRIRSTLGEFAH